MDSRPTSRLACLLLSAALVHQLGASPCGCLEHNHWYQSVVAIVCDQDSHHHTVLGDAVHWGVHAAECDHTAPVDGLVPSRVEPAQQSCGSPTLAAPAAELSPLGCTATASIASARSHAATGLPVRAQTQVFRL